MIDLCSGDLESTPKLVHQRFENPALFLEGGDARNV
jgi:hypothetical protein